MASSVAVPRLLTMGAFLNLRLLMIDFCFLNNYFGRLPAPFLSRNTALIVGIVSWLRGFVIAVCLDADELIDDGCELFVRNKIDVVSDRNLGVKESDKLSGVEIFTQNIVSQVGLLFLSIVHL